MPFIEELTDEVIDLGASAGVPEVLTEYRTPDSAGEEILRVDGLSAWADPAAGSRSCTVSTSA